MLLAGKGGAIKFDWDKVDAWLPEQSCLWLHFDFEDADVGEWLRQHRGLGELAADACDGREAAVLLNVAESEEPHLYPALQFTLATGQGVERSSRFAGKMWTGLESEFTSSEQRDFRGARRF